jgi:hypothetical protein
MEILMTTIAALASLAAVFMFGLWIGKECADDAWGQWALRRGFRGRAPDGRLYPTNCHTSYRDIQLEEDEEEALS